MKIMEDLLSDDLVVKTKDSYIPAIRVKSLDGIRDYTASGFPYIVVATNRSYIPKDKRTWFKYAIQDSITQSENGTLTIKKNSERMVYVIRIKYKLSKVQNTRITIDGEVIKEINYDVQGEDGVFAYIVRVVEVTSTSKITIEFGIEGDSRIYFVYTNGDMIIQEA